MLTNDEINYLTRIPKEKMVRIYPFDRFKVETIQNSIIDRVRESISEVWPLQFLGTSALGISGQKDIDAYILCPISEFNVYIPILMKEFGYAESYIAGATSVPWSWEEDGYNIELYLTDPKSPAMKRQLKVFEILKNDRELLNEYEELKQGFDGKSYRDYQKAKYIFYNKILLKEA